MGIYLCCCHGWGVCTRHFSHGQCWSSASSRQFYYKPVLCPDIGRSLLWLSKERVVFEHALLQEVKSVWSIMPDNARDRMSWSLRLDYKRNMRRDLTMQSHLCSLPHRCRFLFLCSLSIWLAQQRGTLLADRKCLWRPWSCQTSFCHFFLLSYVNCRDWSEIKMTFIWCSSYYLFYTSGPTVPCIILDTGLVNNRRSKVRTSVGHTRICFPSDLSHWLKNIPLSFIYVLLAIRGSYYNYNSYSYSYSSSSSYYYYYYLGHWAGRTRFVHVLSLSTFVFKHFCAWIEIFFWIYQWGTAFGCRRAWFVRGFCSFCSLVWSVRSAVRILSCWATGSPSSLWEPWTKIILLS